MTEEIIKLENLGINVKYNLTDKPVVLLIHFSGGNLNMWEGILPLFEDEYSIIIPDIRGHGKSDKPHSGYHIDDMASDMYMLLRKLKVEHCHIVGSSMGAEIGLSLAASHPELVLSLVCEGALYNEFGEYGLFDGSAEEIENRKELMRTELRARVERIFETKADYIKEERTKLIQEGIWSDYFIPFLENSLLQREDGHYTYSYLNRVRTEYIEKYWDVRFENYYEKITCPILLLPSEEECKNERIRNSISKFTSKVDIFEIEHIDNANHAYVWMQLPIVAGKVVKSFIEKHSL